MPHLTRLFRNVAALFCTHEWARRVDGHRVYLECMQCLSTTPGVDIGQRRPIPTAAPARRQSNLRQVA